VTKCGTHFLMTTTTCPSEYPGLAEHDRLIRQAAWNSPITERSDENEGQPKWQ